MCRIRVDAERSLMDRSQEVESMERAKGTGRRKNRRWFSSQKRSMRYANGPLKRSFDVVIGAILSIITFPFVVLLAIGSAVSYRAWPLFVQQRLGRDGIPFKFMKIRSLPTATLPTANKYVVAALTNTRFGQFIRGSHLDELPQFWLVVTGQMSLVGPRPEFPELAATFDENFVAERLTVRPGISGLWQISDASTGLIGEAPEFDRLYLVSASPRVDAWVIGRTIGEMIGRQTLTLEQFPRWVTGLPKMTVSLEVEERSPEKPEERASVVDPTGAQENSSFPKVSGGPVPSFTCCSVRIDAHTLDSAVDALMSRPSPQVGRAVHLCNAYTLSLARRDPEMARQLNEADLNLPDGMPLIWIGRRLGLKQLSGRVYGPDLMLATMNRGRETGLSHYLYGSTVEVLEKLEVELLHHFPGLRIVGRESPPFRIITEGEETALQQNLIALKPDIVWVALGTPKQDAFVDKFSSQIPATFVAIGAAFDFISGSKRQAPLWMQERGLEWLFRLVHEPRRLASRYLVHNVKFVIGILRARPTVLAE